MCVSVHFMRMPFNRGRGESEDGKSVSAKLTLRGDYSRCSHLIVPRFFAAAEKIFFIETSSFSFRLTLHFSFIDWSLKDPIKAGSTDFDTLSMINWKYMKWSNMRNESLNHAIFRSTRQPQTQSAHFTAPNEPSKRATTTTMLPDWKETGWAS